jgi:hypothetical protein
MRGTFALNNSIYAHTFILVSVAYKLGAIGINKHLRLLLPKNYISTVAFMRMLQRVLISHITMSLWCSTTMDFLMLPKIIK